MNCVPALFLERVVFQFTRTDTLLAGRNLSRLPGNVVSEFYAKRFIHYVWLRNGLLAKESYLNCEDRELDIETPSRTHLRFATIVIQATGGEYITNSKATERLLSATKATPVLLCLQTSDISKEVAKCIESIRLVFELQLYTKITSDVLKIMRSLVKKNTLNKMSIAKEVEIEDETAQLLVDLLKQKQFFRMFLRAKCSAALKTIITSWRENSEEMVGKIICCKERFSELQLPSTEFQFKECNEEEERDAKRAYPFVADWPSITTISVLRNHDGSAVYCFRNHLSS